MCNFASINRNSEGKLVKSETVCRDGEMFYVEKVAFKDWHISLHNFYLISDRISEGHTIVEQKWSYEYHHRAECFFANDYICNESFITQVLLVRTHYD